MDDATSYDDNPEPRQIRFWDRFKKKSQDKVTEDNPPVGHGQMTQNLARLSETRISDIAVPSADIIALPLDSDLETFMEHLRTHGYSRFPVFHETLDDVKGLIHIKDIFMTYDQDLSGENFTLEPFIRPVLFAPPSMRSLTLLQRMQSEHVHMALIIDEYGGVDGLLTIEDILEEIVGDITDEHDEADDDLWQLEKPGVYLVDARTELDEFNNATHANLASPVDVDNVDTIGGLIMTLVSRVPVKGEVIKSDDNTEYEIIEATPRRIKRVRVRLPLIHLEADI